MAEPREMLYVEGETVVDVVPPPEELMVREKLLFTVCAPFEQESVALTVKEDVPDEVGVPVIRPEEFMERPPGRDPETIEKLTGDTPPEELICLLYEEPTVPDVKGDPVEMERDGQGTGFTVMTKFAGSGGPIDAPKGRLHAPGAVLCVAVIV